MAEAFFADKIPQYEKEIAEGTRKVVKLATAKKIFREVCEKYNVKACIAHNAMFDYRSTTRTQRYLTKSKYRYFLPYGVESVSSGLTKNGVTIMVISQRMEELEQLLKFFTDTSQATRTLKKNTQDLLMFSLKRKSSCIA